MFAHKSFHLTPCLTTAVLFSRRRPTAIAVLWMISYLSSFSFWWPIIFCFRLLSILNASSHVRRVIWHVRVKLVTLGRMWPMSGHSTANMIITSSHLSVRRRIASVEMRGYFQSTISTFQLLWRTLHFIRTYKFRLPRAQIASFRNQIPFICA